MLVSYVNRKRTLLFLLGAILCISIGYSGQLIRAESAGFISFSSGIALFSPINMTYNSPNLFLNLTLYSAGSMGYVDSRISMNYSIDEKLNGHVPLIVSNPGVHVITDAFGVVSLPELPEGSHTLTLFLEGFNQEYHEPRFVSYIDTVYFSIDLTAPNTSILSPENKTYTVTSNTTVDVPLDFTTDEDDSQVTYCLDGQNDIVISENTTLIGLPFGSHNLTMYVQDLAGNSGVSENVNFIIAPETGLESDSMPELLPIVSVASASIAVVALAGASLLIYHKKYSSQETLTSLSQGTCTVTL